MHIDFDPLHVEWTTLGSSSSSYSDPPGEEQVGGYNIFRGVPYQRGSGLGAVFRSFLRHLLPIGKQIGAAIGRQGLETGNRVLTNVLEGKDLKESLVTESKSGLKNLLEKAATNLDKQQQRGQGFDFKRYKDPNKEGNVGGIAKMKGRNINRLRSSIGPLNFLPAPPTKKRPAAPRKISKKTKSTTKRLRVDAFGPY